MARSAPERLAGRIDGIFISIVLRDRPQVSQQPRVVLSRHTQRRPQRLYGHAELLLKSPLGRIRLRAETTQEQVLRQPTEIILHINEGGEQTRLLYPPIPAMQFQTAHELDDMPLSDNDGKDMPGELRHHAQSGFGSKL